VFAFKKRVGDFVGAVVAQVHDAASKVLKKCAKPWLWRHAEHAHIWKMVHAKNRRCIPDRGNVQELRNSEHNQRL
jgi:hypothetical protein